MDPKEKDGGLLNTPKDVEALIDALHDLEPSGQGLLLLPVELRDKVYDKLVGQNVTIKTMEALILTMAKPH